MPLTPFDVSNLNESIASIGRGALARRQQDITMSHNTAMENIMMQRAASQEAHQNRLEEMEQNRMGAVESHNRALEQHYSEMEKKVGLRDAFTQTQAAAKDMKDAMYSLGEQVRNGEIDNDTATSYFQYSMDNMDPDMKQHMLSNPAFADAYDGNFGWDTAGLGPENSDRVTWTGTDGTQHAGWKNRKSGAVHEDYQPKPVNLGSDKTQDASGTHTRNNYGIPGQPSATPAFSLVRDANGNLVPAGQAAQQATPGAAPGQPPAMQWQQVPGVPATMQQLPQTPNNQGTMQLLGQ